MQSGVDGEGMQPLTLWNNPTDESGNELSCLRLLRDRILRELNAQRTSAFPQISHGRLLDILRAVRESAVNKRTWDDAIQSSALGDGRTHSITAISGAIKVMLEGYLVSDPVAAEQPITPERIEREAELTAEIDELKQKLTRAVCEIADWKEKTNRLLALQEEVMAHSAEKQHLKQTISSQQAQIDALLSENKALKDRIGQYEIPFVGMSPEQRPSLDEWRATLERLEYLQSHFGEDKSDLLSQIKTLEVQKADVENELTRILKTSTVVSSTRASSPATVSIYNQSSVVPSRRTSVASQFIDFGPSRVIKPPTRRKTAHSSPETCVQQ